MICCTNCFKDIELKACIEGLMHMGDCPLCGEKDTYIYDSDSDFEESGLEELLSSILEIYKMPLELSESVPVDAIKSIGEHLYLYWNIFNIEPEYINQLVKEVFIDKGTFSEKLLTGCAVNELYDEDYLVSHSFLGNHSWSDFKEYITKENRFYCNYLQLDQFEQILHDACVQIKTGQKLFRSRIVTDEKGCSIKELYAPPKGYASAGRVNSKGVSCLYLSSKEHTTLQEIRASAFDYVTVGKFKVLEELRVLDLNSIAYGSPFKSDKDKRDYLINEKHLREISEDLSKPMGRQDSDLEYLPTQYISDFAKFLKYDGVMYASTFDSTSINLAIFDETICKCINHKTHKIANLEYGYE